MKHTFGKNLAQFLIHRSILSAKQREKEVRNVVILLVETSIRHMLDKQTNKHNAITELNCIFSIVNVTLIQTHITFMHAISSLVHKFHLYQFIMFTGSNFVDLLFFLHFSNKDSTVNFRFLLLLQSNKKA